jgi:cytochrome c oxidase accessory protein FixG
LNKKENQEVNFRDRIATVSESGKRNWIYAYKPKGFFYNIRTYLSWVYIIAFFGLPFIQIQGRPLFLFDVTKAKFIFFGKIFWPQDFFIFGLGMITFIFFIILFTAAFGRLFCGWACPQTIFMEMLFRKIEYAVLGSAAKQKQLDKSPWNVSKIVKVSIKHILFFLLSFLIANFFLAYVIGIKELEKIITEPVSLHIVGFASIVIFSFVFYGVYAFFREQACTVVCPYGRLQSVLLDKNSMIVAYDYKRGEPRGFDKTSKENLGDCIDCHQCVNVCPTGIDIRNGVQMECVACTACIDACDAIMVGIKKPTGLIRYASENGIEKGEPLQYTKRMKIYSALCLLVLSVLAVILFTRNDIDTTIIRTPGLLYQERGKDSISNLFNIKLVNKTTNNIPLKIKVENKPSSIQFIGKNFVNIEKEGQGAGTFFIILPRSEIKERKTILKIGLYANGEKLTEVKTNFLGPIKN